MVFGPLDHSCLGYSVVSNLGDAKNRGGRIRRTRAAAGRGASLFRFLLAAAQDYWHAASQVLQLACKHSSLSSKSLTPNTDFVFPFAGGLLWHYYKIAPSQKEGLQLIENLGIWLLVNHTNLLGKQLLYNTVNSDKRDHAALDFLFRIDR